MDVNQWNYMNTKVIEVKFLLNRLFNEREVKSSMIITAFLVRLLENSCVEYEVTRYHKSGLGFDVIRLVDKDG